MAKLNLVELRVGDRVVAEYLIEPDVGPRLSPRPYLHPVRTLSGAVTSDEQPADHPHHLGVSLAVQDVNKTNLWGGKTYVRGSGYTELDDHGAIAHLEFAERGPDRLTEKLEWLDHNSAVLLTETREIAARAIDDQVWALQFGYALTAPGNQVTLGSPATNGRDVGSGYGGFFWRMLEGDEPPAVYTSATEGEADVNGSTDPWVAVVNPAYSLVFTGLGNGDRWFVRAAGYPGVCAALAWNTPLVIPAKSSLRRRHVAYVADGALDRSGVEDLVDQGVP